VGATCYRTDLFGSIAIVTDGNAFDIRTEFFDEE